MKPSKHSRIGQLIKNSVINKEISRPLLQDNVRAKWLHFLRQNYRLLTYKKLCIIHNILVRIFEWFRSVVLKVGGISPWRRFWGSRGRKNKGGDRGEKCSTTTSSWSLSLLPLTIIELISAVTLVLSKQRNRLLISEVTYDCTSLKCLPIFRSFVKVAKHFCHTELGIMVCIDF